MIHGLDRFNLARDGRRRTGQKGNECRFLFSRPHHKDLLAIRQGVGDILVEERVVVSIDMVVAMLLVWVRMSRVCLKGFGFRRIFVEVDNLSFGMVEPDDGVIE